ncbi:hypothetical protein ABK040_002882 [Willaertia magna]
MNSDNIRVCVRVRPLNEKEKKQNNNAVWKTVNNNTIYQIPLNSSSNAPVIDTSYTFDHVYDSTIGTESIYQDMCKSIVVSSVQGYNGTIFAYGQTSSGKTHTMKGSDESSGIIPLAINEIFKTISQTTNRNFQIRVSYLEIYNEKIIDLLEPENNNLKIREDFINGKGVYVEGLTEKEVGSMEEMLSLMDNGEKNRHFGATGANERSSRSHTIYRVIIESMDASVSTKEIMEDDSFDILSNNQETSVLYSTLNLVDLAGSERVSYTLAEGQRLKEGGHINKSLLTLGNVIAKLSEGSSSVHIPYRNSKLTRILSSALGGNSKTVIICTITPALQHSEETHSTLKFANRAKNIKNTVTVNELLNEKGLLRKLKKENEEWRNKFQERVNQIEDEVSRLDKEKESLIQTYEMKLSNISNQKEQEFQIKLNELIQKHQSEICTLKLSYEQEKTLIENQLKDKEWELECSIKQSDSKLQNFIQDMHSKVNNYENEKLSNNVKLQNLEQNNKLLEEELKQVKLDFTNQIEELNTKLMERDLLITQKEETIKTLQSKEIISGDILQQMKDLKDQLEKETRLVNQLRDLVELKDKEINESEQKNKNLIVQIEKEKYDLITNYNNYKQQSENELLDVKNKLLSSEALLQEKDKEIILLKEQTDNERNKNSTLMSQLSETKESESITIKELEDCKTELLSQLVEKTNMIDGLTLEIEDLRDMAKVEIEQKNKEIIELKNEILSLRDSLERRDETITQLQIEMVSLKSLNEDYVSLQVSYQDQNQALKELKEELDGAIDRIRDLEQEKNNVIVEVSEKYEYISKIQQENQQLKKLNEELQSKIRYGKEKSKELFSNNPQIIKKRKFSLESENKENIP